MDKHPIGDLMAVTMEKIREMVDANTIIGQPIHTQDGITLIPVSKASFGFASGGSDFQGKQPDKQNPFGGGAGAGVKITPVAFLVIKDGNVRVIGVDSAAGSSPIEKAIDAAPAIIDKVSDVIEKNFGKGKSAQETEAEK